VNGYRYSLHAVPVKNLYVADIRKLESPIILHVKQDPKKQKYEHYELFLGTEDGKARVFDPPQPVRSIPFHELAAQWDGTGLIISDRPIQLSHVFATSRKWFAVGIGSLLLIMLVFRWGRTMYPSILLFCTRPLGMSFVQAGMTAAAAMLVGYTYHCVFPGGLLASPSIVQTTQAAHAGSFIPKVRADEIPRLLDGSAVFVDARFKRDFESGHLQDAINVPVDANDVQRERAMQQVSKDRPVIVYCQSAGCKYAEKVAIRLMEDGFQNVSIFRGGWREWAAQRRQDYAN
jgi:rhodanese-related sulfurtransferase